MPTILRKLCPICSGRKLTLFSTIESNDLLICKRCRHIFFASIPSTQRLNEHYKSAYTDMHHQLQLQLNNSDYYLDHFNELKNIAGASEDFDILDYGCSYPIFLEQAKLQGANVLGCDFSDEAVAYGKNLEIEIISPDQFPMVQKKFDVIRFSHCLEHLVDPLKVLKTAASLLKKNGFIYITQPSIPCFKSTQSSFGLDDAVYPSHLHFFNPVSLLYLARGANLEIAEIFTHGDEEVRFGKYNTLCDYEYITQFHANFTGCLNTFFGVLNNFPYYMGRNSRLILKSANALSESGVPKKILGSDFNSLLNFRAEIIARLKTALSFDGARSLMRENLSFANSPLKTFSNNSAHEISIEKFNDVILWELPIQHVASDIVNSGDSILDIGGNTGGVAVAFSRMVGETGTVFTFEPNPEMYPTLLKTLTENSVKNITLIPLAAFSSSSLLLDFYSDPSYYKVASRLKAPLEGGDKFSVLTISIDDFCIKNSIFPSFIKIDVEGAEIDVLRSMATLLKNNPVPIVVEYKATIEPSLDDPLNYLQKFGYIFFDVNTYENVSAHSYSQIPDLPLSNVLCIPSGTDLATRYLSLRKNVVFDSSEMKAGTLILGGIELDPGRYIIEIKFDCPCDAIAMLAIKNPFGEILTCYQASGQQLREQSNSNLVIQLKKSQKITVEFIKMSEFSASLKSVAITHLDFTLDAK